MRSQQERDELFRLVGFHSPKALLTRKYLAFDLVYFHLEVIITSRAAATWLCYFYHGQILNMDPVS